MILTYNDYIKEHNETFAISTFDPCYYTHKDECEIQKEKKENKKAENKEKKDNPNSIDDTDKQIVNEVYTYKPSLTPIGYDLKIGYAIIKKWIEKDEVYSYEPVDDILKNIEENPNNIYDTQDALHKQIPIEIPAKTGAIIVSLDSIYLSDRIAGTVHARATLSAHGLIINPITIDPNYKGRLVFYIFNSNHKSIVLKEKDTIATLILHRTVTPTNEHPQKDSLLTMIDSYKDYDVQFSEERDTQKSKDKVNHPLHTELMRYFERINDTKTHSNFEIQCVKVNKYIGQRDLIKKAWARTWQFVGKWLRIDI